MARRMNKYSMIYVRIRQKHPDWSKARLRSATKYVLRGSWKSNHEGN